MRAGRSTGSRTRRRAAGSIASRSRVLADRFRVDTLSVESLSMAPGDNRPDHEGIVLLPDGTFAVSARRHRPRAATGSFDQHLRPARRFRAPPSGARQVRTRGDRDRRRMARGRNAGFEGLTLSPDGERLFTAAETALIQDGDAATFDAGARTRIIEYVARRGTFVPAREFAYDLEPCRSRRSHPSFYINGLVELLVGEPHDAPRARAWICREQGQSRAELQSHPVVPSQPDRCDRRLGARIAQRTSRRSSRSRRRC